MNNQLSPVEKLNEIKRSFWVEFDLTKESVELQEMFDDIEFTLNRVPQLTKESNRLFEENKLLLRLLCYLRTRLNINVVKLYGEDKYCMDIKYKHGDTYETISYEITKEEFDLIIWRMLS